MRKVTMAGQARAVGLALIAGIVALGGLAACSSSGSSHGCAPGEKCAAPPGTVRGLLIRTGGPRGTPPVRLAGTITVHRGGSSGSVVTTTKAGARGEFTVLLDYGTYTFVGSSPQVRGAGPCRADRPVEITQARVTAQPPRDFSVVVVCGIK